jgi:hypothetical protein
MTYLEIRKFQLNRNGFRKKIMICNSDYVYYKRYLQQILVLLLSRVIGFKIIPSLITHNISLL